MAIRQPHTPRIKPPTRPKWQSRYHGARMTPEEYLALPEEKPYLEYVDGVVLQKPMPDEEHSELARELAYHLTVWLKKKKRGRAGIEARARLGDLPNYRLPDISYWKPGIARGEQAPPTLAAEIRSRGQTLAELRRKCEFLRSTGVEACWLIDPVSRTAELYEGRKKSGTNVDTLTAACLPDFELSLSDLFAILDE
ncbi:MAG: Uma2 family endonuclease [Dehalococcoidia bacterium]